MVELRPDEERKVERVRRSDIGVAEDTGTGRG